MKSAFHFVMMKLEDEALRGRFGPGSRRDCCFAPPKCCSSDGVEVGIKAACVETVAFGWSQPNFRCWNSCLVGHIAEAGQQRQSQAGRKTRVSKRPGT